MNTALIAEYLVRTHFPPQFMTGDDFRKLDELALRLAMELPNEVLSVIWAAKRTNTYQDVWNAVDTVRQFTCPDDPRDPENIIRHFPNMFPPPPQAP